MDAWEAYLWEHSCGESNLYTLVYDANNMRGPVSTHALRQYIPPHHDIVSLYSGRTWYSNLPAIPGFPFMILYAICTSKGTPSSRSGGSSRMKFVALASAVEES